MELFSEEEVTQKSPKAAWMEKHDCHARRNPDVPEDPWEAWFGEDRWKAADKQMHEIGDLDGPYLAIGESEEEAIKALAKSKGIPCWREEQYQEQIKESEGTNGKD